MTDFLKEALAQVPAFFLKFSRAFAQPRALGSGIKKATAKGTTAELNDAFIFLGICLLVTALCKSAIFREADVTAMYRAKDALWKAVLVLGLAAVMRVTWRMMGGAASFEKYVVANCLLFWVFSVLAHIVLLIGNRAFGSIVRLPPATFLPFYATTIGPLLLWALYCWRAYGDLNEASWKRSISALLIVLLLGGPRRTWPGNVHRQGGRSARSSGPAGGTQISVR